jgi:hypothetical protein
MGDVSLDLPHTTDRVRGQSGRAPLLGHNLVRLLYLDEAGIDHGAPAMCVSGVLVHGDNQWPEIDKRIGALIEKYIPYQDRLGFVFHATDLFHGSRYFDRRLPQWTQKLRWTILAELAAIIDELHLPVVAGTYQKDKFGIGILAPDMPQKHRGNLMHDSAAMDCLIWADRWLAKYAPAELATVVHEDGTPAKQLIKHTVRLLRDGDRLLDADFDLDLQNESGLPLKRIIDTVHFAEKPDARPLQLADLCAFILARAAKSLSVPDFVFGTIWQHLKWTLEMHREATENDPALMKKPSPEGRE